MFVADLHIHSKYSRATARNLDLENLFIAAQLKGISVVATGDFTHPGWLEEITTKLIAAEPGMFRLQPDLAAACRQQVPAACHRSVRFMLATEISNIYKKNERTRKNHNLVFFPTIESVATFNRQLEKIGNLASDGRPILGLDARNLLEMVLETDDEGFLIPAHIWTPWFSLFGSKSGFDSLSECFEDLSSHIFAVETGLSSDPPMNWRVSQLDGLTLVSNSDAHSPAKLGREANLFNTDISFKAIRQALEDDETGRFIGTFEFFPEEGKYHFDGHRKCGIRCHPQETIALDGNCPVCGKPMTLGVLNRVQQLADRPDGLTPPITPRFHRLVPLTDLLSEILQVGPGSKKVRSCYHDLLTTHGSELDILHSIEPGLLDRSGVPLLSEGITRMRQAELRIEPGFDGEFGRIRLFSENERSDLAGQRPLFSVPEPQGQEDSERQIPPIAPRPKPQQQTLPFIPTVPTSIKADLPAVIDTLNQQQREAVNHGLGPLLIVAGPGTGKTMTLTCRIALIMTRRRVDPDRILAVTFTQKAAQEMTRRIQCWVDEGRMPTVGTFHGVCRRLICRDHSDDGRPQPTLLDDIERQEVVAEALRQVFGGESQVPPVRQVVQAIVRAKQRLLTPDDDLDSVAAAPVPDDAFRQIFASYEQICRMQRCMDFDDLIGTVVRRLEAQPDYRRRLQQRFDYIFVDEYQDLNFGQYRLIRALAPPGANICVIGDPNQAIYGFRGSDVAFFQRFAQDYPETRQIRLTRNYRSVEAILESAHHLIDDPRASGTSRVTSGLFGTDHIELVATENERSEAVAIGKTIETLVGGTGFHSLDFDTVDGRTDADGMGFADIAVLFRTRQQGRVLSEVLSKAGIPNRMAHRDQWRDLKAVGMFKALLRLYSQSARYGDLDRLKDLVGPKLASANLDAVKTWAIHNHWTVSQALKQMKRFPIAGLDAANQTGLVEHYERIARLHPEKSGLELSQWIERLLARTRLGAAFSASESAKAALDHILSLSFGCSDCSELESRMTLQSDVDTLLDQAEKVSLMTLHSAKGLEFPVVFIAGCESGLIPLVPLSGEPSDVQEERRLLYVGLTRSQERLYLTYARRRTLYGQTVAADLSPFVGDIPDRLLKHNRRIEKHRRRPGPVQLDLFSGME